MFRPVRCHRDIPDRRLCVRAVQSPSSGVPDIQALPGLTPLPAGMVKADLERNTDQPSSCRRLSVCRSTRGRLFCLPVLVSPRSRGPCRTREEASPANPQVPDFSPFACAFRGLFGQEERLFKEHPKQPVEANITPAYCGCQEATTIYCYYTPPGSILPVIVRQVNGVFQPLDSRTIDPVLPGFNARL